MSAKYHLDDWLFDRVIQLDTAAPGLAGMMFRCSIERRQVVAAFLSVQSTYRPFVDDASIGDFLMSARHDDILEAAFGTVPEGLRGALRRAGSRTHERRFYSYLYALMASERRAEMQALVQLLKKVTPCSLATARVLPADLRTPTLVSMLASPDRARDVSRLVALLTDAGVDREAMCVALRSVKTMNEVIEFAGRWAFRANLPPHPVLATEFYFPVEHGSKLKHLALKHRNCLKNLLANALDGRAAFSVVQQQGEEAIVHLIYHQGQWTLHEVRGSDNRLPSSALDRLARDYLQKHGIERRRRFRSVDSKWEPLRRLAGGESHQIAMEEVMLG